MNQTQPATLIDTMLNAAFSAPMIDSLPDIAQGIIDDIERGQANVYVVRQNPALGTQIARLRWMFADGRTPFLLMPSTPAEYFQLMDFAAQVAAEFQLPSVITVEQELLNLMNARKFERDLSWPLGKKLQRADAVPFWTGPDAALRRWQSLVCGNADSLARFIVDKQPPGEAKTDWLVISYGCTASAAQDAVEQARGKNLGVDHLILQTLSPLPERAIANAAMGKRFIVVPERNVGQLHADIQRLCPSQPVVLVSSALEPMTPELVLGALLRFPRCC